MSTELDSQLRRYAELILKIGLNLRAGQRLLISDGTLYGVDLEVAPFVRIVAETAYDLGASMVDVVWEDPLLRLMRLKKAPPESLGTYPKWHAAARLEHIEAGDAFLRILAENPDLLKSQDPKRVATMLSAMIAPVKPASDLLGHNAVNWCVIAAPIPTWAAAVLPGTPEAERENGLWRLIFETCRMGAADPIASWRKHVADLGARADYLMKKQYEWLKYSGPGTDLRVGLPPGHEWHGGQVTAESGITFVPNLPTEEIFTLPHRGRVEGTVASTKPFVFSGNTVDGMSLTFAEGKVVSFKAKSGEPILREMLAMDDGASHLGEVALVPASSPISRMGVTFHNTLFDENAASHLAFGEAYRFTLEDAASSSDDEFRRRGGNISKIHADFMVGSASLDLDGILPGGKTEPIMRSGEWAFRV